MSFGQNTSYSFGQNTDQSFGGFGGGSYTNAPEPSTSQNGGGFASWAPDLFGAFSQIGTSYFQSKGMQQQPQGYWGGSPTTTKNNTMLYVVIAIVVLVVLFIVFRRK